MIVGVLISYIILQALMGFFYFILPLGVWCEAEKKEWGRVIGCLFMLSLIIIVNVMVVDIFFFGGHMFDSLTAWLVSEI